MPVGAVDIVLIGEARARLTGWPEDVMGSSAEKVPTKNGASCVARVDAHQLDGDHAREAEHANLVLAEDAITGLRQVLAGAVHCRRRTGPRARRPIGAVGVPVNARVRAVPELSRAPA